jgi:hypothetical protein
MGVDGGYGRHRLSRPAEPQRRLESRRSDDIRSWPIPHDLLCVLDLSSSGGPPILGQGTFQVWELGHQEWTGVDEDARRTRSRYNIHCFHCRIHQL